MIWVVFALMTAAALALLLWPLLRRRDADAARPSYDIEVYRDQLAEIERDREAGLLSSDEAAEARAEVERRILALGEGDLPAEPARAAPARSRFVAAGMALALPIAAALIYVEVGQPHLPGLPFAAGSGGGATQMAGGAGGGEQAAGNAEMVRMVDELAKRLALEPRNTEGWLMLARSYRSLDRLADSVNAYRQALNNGADAQARSEMGEVIVILADGNVAPAAREAFQKTLEENPADPRARYYLGLARMQAGDAEGALERWQALRAESPADAPWLDLLNRQIVGAAAELGRPPPEAPEAPAAPAGPRMAQRQDAPQQGASQPRGPSQEQMRAAQQMSLEDRQQMIRGMVEGLAARLEQNPDDAAGWQRLARSYGVLNEPEKAREAWAKAAALTPDDPDVLLAYAGAIAQTAPPEEPLPEVREIAEKVLAIDPSRAEGLWFLGLAHARDGQTESARTVWSRLLDSLPPGSPARTELQQRIDRLGG